MPPAPRFYIFSVSGTGPFPFDMLRYDSCWPLSEVDSGVIERTTRHRQTGPFHLNLKGLRPPTIARWASFGWEATTT